MKKLSLCAALLVSSLQLVSAQIQTNLDVFFFGPPATPVWDISGIYRITNHMESPKIRPLDIIFNDIGIGVDAHGKVIGAGTILVLVGDGIVGGDYKVTGKMSGGGEKTRANFTVKFKGNGTVAGVVTTCKITAKYNLEILPATRTMAGKTSGNANFSHLGSGNLNGATALPLPPGVDGGWNVTLDMIPFGKQLSGTAVFLVDNTPSTALATKVKGNLQKATVAKVKLTGTGNSAGTQLNMEFTPLPGLTNAIAKINGKVLGQKVKN